MLDPNTATVIDTLGPVVLQAIPQIIAALKSSHAQQNPSAPVPSDVSVLAALQAAAAASIAKDETWKAAHPTVTDQTGTHPAVD